MDTIGSAALVTFLDGVADCVSATNTRIRKDPGFRVSTFLDLAARVAELQFRNREHLLLFRGQRSDHRNRQGNTSLKPSLFRPLPTGPRAGAEARWQTALAERFARLDRLSQALAERYRAHGLLGVDRISKHRLVRWAILQHYGICPTPLLDVTHSLRIAATFAALDADQEAFVYVLGVPNLSGATTASTESGVQIIRLASACPPRALRPHIQEGYLLGEYPEIDSLDQNAHYAACDVDFGKRLIGKFCFDPRTFWTPDFPRISREALYPTPVQDPLSAIACELAQQENP